uniref:Uncharacterized protein n=1 Tax=Arundo donax TaxID=35708 RepID=A0A0A9G0I4_ARUDO
MLLRSLSPCCVSCACWIVMKALPWVIFMKQWKRQRSQ